MPHWLVVILLGIVEGLTEFIPVSSTGHLLIIEHWLGSHQSDLFNVVIQVGAVLAVLPLFRDRITMLTRLHEPASRLLAAKIFFAFFVTGVGGYLLKKNGFTLPDESLPIAVALVVGGVVFILVETILRGRQLIDDITWPVVLAVAVGQLVAAAFPGASRSGATIMFAMILGTHRVRATEFSFLVGIPTMLAAGAYEIYGELKHGGTEDWGMLALGFAAAAVVSFLAVKWLLRFVQSHTFIGFGVYRIVFGAALLWLVWPRS